MSETSRKFHDAWQAFCEKHRHLGYLGSFQSAEGILRSNRDELIRYGAAYRLRNRSWMADQNFDEVMLHILTNGRLGSLPERQ
jgi:hypothetical protein